MRPARRRSTSARLHRLAGRLPRRGDKCTGFYDPNDHSRPAIHFDPVPPAGPTVPTPRLRGGGGGGGCRPRSAATRRRRMNPAAAKPKGAGAAPTGTARPRGPAIGGRGLRAACASSRQACATTRDTPAEHDAERGLACILHFSSDARRFLAGAASMGKLRTVGSLEPSAGEKKAMRPERVQARSRVERTRLGHPVEDAPRPARSITRSPAMSAARSRRRPRVRGAGPSAEWSNGVRKTAARGPSPRQKWVIDNTVGSHRRHLVRDRKTYEDAKSRPRSLPATLSFSGATSNALRVPRRRGA